MNANPSLKKKALLSGTIRILLNLGFFLRKENCFRAAFPLPALLHCTLLVRGYTPVPARPAAGKCPFPALNKRHCCHFLHRDNSHFIITSSSHTSQLYSSIRCPHQFQKQWVFYRGFPNPTIFLYFLPTAPCLSGMQHILNKCMLLLVTSVCNQFRFWRHFLQYVLFSL